MYASLEDAWQDPLLVPSDRGFVLHPRRRPDFLSDGPATAPSAGLEYEPMPPASIPRAYVPRRVDVPLQEGFEGAVPRNAYVGPTGWPQTAPPPSSPPPYARDEVLRELQRLREELEWIRQDRVEVQRRLDFVCAMLFGLSILLLSDLIRRWTPTK